MTSEDMAINAMPMFFKLLFTPSILEMRKKKQNNIKPRFST